MRIWISLIAMTLCGAARAQPSAGSSASASAPASASGPAVSTTAATVAPASVPLEPFGSQTNISIEKVVFAVDVSSHIPVGASDAFDSSVPQVYCWNQIAIPQPPANIKHEWYWKDKKVGQMVIEARFHRMRIWTKHWIRPGPWRVEIKDADTDQLITVGAFLVRKAQN